MRTKRFLWAAAAAGVFMFLLSPFTTDTRAEVMINEFLTYNVNTNADMCDFGSFSKWIELYNNSDSAADLSGYYLTKKIKDPTAWAIPAGAVIPAKGYMLFWADKNDDKPGHTLLRDYYPFTISFTTKRYHTNFSLSELGGEIGLFKTVNGAVTLVDSVSYPRQLPDVSMGRSPTDGKWYKFDTPTPGAANTTTPKPVELLRYAAPVLFSIPGGFYSSAQTVTLNPQDGKVIYYTINGDIPRENAGIKYTAPITVNSTMVITARCVDPDKIVGPIVSNTYFINEKARTMMTISIQADSAFLWDSTVGIYTNSYKGQSIPASLDFFTPDGKQVIDVTAGMALGSLTSYMTPQKPLQLTVSNKYGSGNISYQLFDKLAWFYAKLRIRNSGDSWNTNFISDGLVEAMIGAGPAMIGGQLDNTNEAYRPVVIYINGKYWGVQDMRENFDGQYLTNNYGIDPATLNDIKATILGPQPYEDMTLASGTWDDYRSMMSIAKSGVDAAKFAQLDSLIDMNSFIDYVCSEDYAVNISWGHNREMWKIAKSTAYDGKWRCLLEDFDRGFIHSYVNINLLNTDPPDAMSKSIMNEDTLFGQLIAYDGFKKLFLQRFAAHLNSTFSPSRMTRLIDSLSALLAPEMADEASRWKDSGGIQSVVSWQKSVDSMRQFAAERPVNVFGELNTQFGVDTARLTITPSIAGAGNIYVEGVKLCSGDSGLILFKNIPVHLSADPNPGYVFAGWGGSALSNTTTLTLTGNQSVTATFAQSQDHILPSTISTNTTLNLTDHPYVGQTDIIVARGATLTVEKGVTIAMEQDAGIYVKGRMIVNGTADAPVTIRPDTVSGATTWAALCFDTTDDTNKLVYMNVWGTTIGKDPLNNRGGINGNSARMYIDHLHYTNAIYLMCFEANGVGSVICQNCYLENAKLGNGAIHVGGTPAGGCIIEHNTVNCINSPINCDGIDIKRVKDAIIRGNHIYKFDGFNSDGIDLGEKAVNVLIDSNYIFGNADKGVSCGGASTCKLTNNVIVECDMGIGVKDSNSYAELDHNTFVRNRKGVAVYEKTYGRGGSKAVVRNMILSGQKIKSIFVDSASTVDVSYSISDMDYLPGNGNLFGNVMFMDPLKNNFQLAPNSPCLKNGDPNSPKNADGSRTDIGAQYTFNANDFPSPLCSVFSNSIVINEVMYKENTTINSKDWVELFNPTSRDIDISNWKFTDRDYPVTNPLWSDLPALPSGSKDTLRVFTIPASTKLAAGGYLVLCASVTDFKSAYPEVSNYCKDTLPFHLTNTERLALYNSADSLVAFVSYNPNAPWPAVPNDGGVSLELRNPNYFNHYAQNWGASAAIGGTPGRQNSIYSTLFAINKPRIANNQFFLAQNYPNPCKGKTTIMFSLPKKDHVQLCIYSLAGRKLETLVDSELKPGVHKVSWNTRTYSPGVYLYRMKTSDITQIMKANVK